MQMVFGASENDAFHVCVNGVLSSSVPKSSSTESNPRRQQLVAQESVTLSLTLDTWVEFPAVGLVLAQP